MISDQMTALGTTDRGFHFRIAQASRNDNLALWQRSAVEHRRIEAPEC
ncbi:hypothetical protein [Paracoccus yeei]|nr:hypothetical protein [Paracoccus yeei]